MSDWSSDVCSSDLIGIADQLAERDRAIFYPSARPVARIGRRRRNHARREIASRVEDGPVDRERHALALLILRIACLHAGRARPQAQFDVGIPVHPDINRPFGRDDIAITGLDREGARSEEHTSELQSLMRISYAVFCLKKKNNKTPNTTTTNAALNKKTY